MEGNSNRSGKRPMSPAMSNDFSMAPYERKKQKMLSNIAAKYNITRQYNDLANQALQGAPAQSSYLPPFPQQSAASQGMMAMQMISGASSNAAPKMVTVNLTLDELKKLMAASNSTSVQIPVHNYNAPPLPQNATTTTATQNLTAAPYPALTQALAVNVNDTADFFDVMYCLIDDIMKRPVSTFTDHEFLHYVVKDTAHAIKAVENEAGRRTTVPEELSLARRIKETKQPETRSDPTGFEHAKECFDLYWAQNQLKAMGRPAAQAFFRSVFKSSKDLHMAHVMSGLQLAAPAAGQVFDIGAAFRQAISQWDTLSESQQARWADRLDKLHAGDISMLSQNFGNDLAGHLMPVQNQGAATGPQARSGDDGIKIKSEDPDDRQPQQFAGLTVIPNQPAVQRWQTPKHHEDGVMFFDATVSVQALHAACAKAFRTFGFQGIETLGTGVYFARLGKKQRKFALVGRIDVAGKQLKPEIFDLDPPRFFVGCAPAVRSDIIIATIAFTVQQRFTVQEASEDVTFIVTFAKVLRSTGFTISVPDGPNHIDIDFKPSAPRKCRSCSTTHPVTSGCKQYAFAPMPDVPVPLYRTSFDMKY
ncbi:hypothetical protein LTR37_017601 [Vermiconidia calcicola]|uniref:Uncharacterized protein n=1 Tax=Vermiconidia calcicola TaxID=1690605 RepID=A0ACC3MKH0_9PEZI|nr:hypothetical protein LTR37_017601 [Vermiconidia calcicola]